MVNPAVWEYVIVMANPDSKLHTNMNKNIKTEEAEKHYIKCFKGELASSNYQ